MKKIILLLTVMFVFTTMTASNYKNLDYTIAEVYYKNQKPLNNVATTSKNGISEVYKDSKSAVSTVYSDLKSLTPSLKQYVEEIAKLLKTTANNVWEILVKQQKVWSWCFLALELLSLLSVYRFLKQYHLTKTEKTDTGETLATNWVLLAGLGIASSILTYNSILHFEQMMTGFINPEFGALRNLIEYVEILKNK